MKTSELPVLQTLDLQVGADLVAVLRVDRPERMNSMTVGMFSDIRSAALALRDSDVRAMVLTGTGDRAFCAGFDLDEVGVIAEMGIREFLQFQELATGSLAAIRALPFPVIAAVNGAASGGGLSLALACDIRIASTTAKFNAAFVRVGLSAGELGTSWQLTRLVGPGRAAEIAFTARTVEADEALRIGLVNRVVPPGHLIDEAMTMAGQISQNSPGGVRLSKRALHRNQEIGSYAAALELENRGQALLTRGDDMTEALTAFKEKRPPTFTGR
jgi:enoyl-CoA hydratase/carnithine racemase